MTQTVKRVCIMGTAQSWKKSPWADASWEIWGLNDGYCLLPPRFNRWYELHPLDKMAFRSRTQTVIAKESIPEGHYVRPEGHLDWLKAQSAAVPVFLQKEPPSDWPANAHRFPIEAVEAEFGAYWASGPAYMLAHAVLEGYTEIMVTGIHLATEAEYREQRPQWEMLLGRVLGRSVTESTRPGFRVYTGAVTIVLPDECPILKHGWKYAYEPKPAPPANPYRDELKRTVRAKNDLATKLIHWPVGKDKSAEMEQLRRLDVIEDDCRHLLQMAALAADYGPIQASLGG
ncbi:MAG: hypothetical protein RLZZ373_373 [Pseudomonadota bacterium]|jgi:hypothetical protein